MICPQDYLGIVDFLTALPLKSREERRDFFGGLTRRLFSVPEETVAIQGRSSAVQSVISTVSIPGLGRTLLKESLIRYFSTKDKSKYKVTNY